MAGPPLGKNILDPLVTPFFRPTKPRLHINSQNRDYISVPLNEFVIPSFALG